MAPAPARPVHGHDEKGKLVGDVIRTIPLFMGLFVFHVGCSVKAYRAGGTTQIKCFRIPLYMFNFHEYFSVVQMLVLIWMLSTCPKLYCLGAWYDEYSGSGVLSDWCPGAISVRGAYGVFSAFVMLIFFLRTVFLEHMVCSQLSRC